VQIEVFCVEEPCRCPSLSARMEVLRRLQCLHHPHIEPVLDVLPGRRALAALYGKRAGCSLASRLVQRGPLPWPMIARLAHAIADALRAAAEVGIVHGRLDADRILLGRGPEPPWLAGLGELADVALPGADAAGDARALARVCCQAVLGRPPRRGADGRIETTSLPVPLADLVGFSEAVPRNARGWPIWSEVVGLLRLSLDVQSRPAGAP
jgi:hypothetical protein